jgi:UDP-glucuronate decarboxylase
LCETLLNRGHDVLCVDNYFTGRRRNIEHLTKFPRFEAMRHDVTFPLYVEMDTIYNLPVLLLRLAISTIPFRP